MQVGKRPSVETIFDATGVFVRGLSRGTCGAAFATVRLHLGLTVLLLLAAREATAGDQRLGVMADVGVPDGAVASLAYLAHPLIMAHAGVGHNANGFGLRAGAQITAFESRVVPYLAIEGGHYFRSATPEWLKESAKDAGLDDKSLERLGYQFVNAHLGLRFGTNVSFYAQAGLSFIHATANVIKPKPTIVPPVDLYRETTVNVWALSGQAGLVYVL